MSDLAFVSNVLATLPSLVEMARLHPDLSHEEVAARWLSVPSSYRVPASYTASDALVEEVAELEAESDGLQRTKDELYDHIAELEAENKAQRTDWMTRQNAIELERRQDEAASTVLVRELKAWRQRAEQAEAATMHLQQLLCETTWPDALIAAEWSKARAEQAESERDALTCCGACSRCGVSGPGAIPPAQPFCYSAHDGWSTSEQRSSAVWPLGYGNVSLGDSCHYTPPRWEARP